MPGELEEVIVTGMTGMIGFVVGMRLETLGVRYPHQVENKLTQHKCTHPCKDTRSRGASDGRQPSTATPGQLHAQFSSLCTMTPGKKCTRILKRELSRGEHSGRLESKCVRGCRSAGVMPF